MILQHDDVGTISKPRKVSRLLYFLAGLGLLVLPAWGFSEPRQAGPASGGIIATALDNLHTKFADTMVIAQADSVVFPKPAAKPPVLDAQPVIADKVKFAQVVSGMVSDYEIFTGSLESAAAVQITAPWKARIKSLVASGTVVDRNTPVFELDVRQQEDVMRAESEINRIEKELARVRRIARPSNPALAILRNELLEAEGERDKIKGKLDPLIKAPIRGRIHLNFSNEDFDEVPSGFVLATIASADSLRVTFNMSENSFLKLRRSKRPNVGRASLSIGSPVEVSVAGEPELYAGTIVEIGSKFDPKTQTVRCRASIPNPDGIFIPGMSASVSLAISEPHKALLLPSQACLGSDPQLCRLLACRVLVVNADRSILENRTVDIGQEHQGSYVVQAGLKEGQWVVVAGHEEASKTGKIKPPDR